MSQNEFFGGQPIFSTIVEHSSYSEFTKTPYHYEARECVNTAVVNIVNGTAKEDYSYCGYTGIQDD